MSMHQACPEDALDQAVDRAEREAIRNQPELPPPGSPARLALDKAHAAMVRGLLAGARSQIPSISPNRKSQND